MTDDPDFEIDDSIEGAYDSADVDGDDEPEGEPGDEAFDAR